jgi:hypothetical protein
LQLLLAFASAVILGCESRGAHGHISDSRLPNLEGQVPVLISQEQGGPVIPPGTGFAFRRLL